MPAAFSRARSSGAPPSARPRLLLETFARLDPVALGLAVGAVGAVVGACLRGIRVRAQFGAVESMVDDA